MARPPASRSGRDRPQALQAGQWLGSLRFSWFLAVMLGLVVLAAVVLVPTVGTFVAQRQQIAQLEQQVTATEEEIESLRAQQERSKDPAYITTQARERLYYTNPGELVYLVVNDIDQARVPGLQRPVSDEIGQTRTDWMGQLLQSVVHAGTSQVVAE